jgi:hypothetical protein
VLRLPWPPLRGKGRRRARAAAGALFLAALAVAAPAGAQDGDRWTFQPVLRQTFTNNLFLTSDDPFADRALSLTLNVGYSRTSGRWRLGALGWVSGVVFGDAENLDDVRFGLGVTAERALSPQSTLTLTGAWSDGVSVESFFVNPVDAPQFDVQTFSAGIGYGYRFSPRTTGGLSLGGTIVRSLNGLPDFVVPPPAPVDVLVPLAPPPSDPLDETVPQPDLIEPRGLDNAAVVAGLVGRDGVTRATDYRSWTLGATLGHRYSSRTGLSTGLLYRRNVDDDNRQVEGQVGVSRAIDSRTNVSATYTGLWSAYPGSDFFSHTLLLRADKAPPRRRIRLDVSAGVTYVDSEDPSWTLIGGFGVSLPLGRTMLAARYDHSRYQSVLFPRNYDTHSFSLSMSRRLTRSLFILGFGTWLNANDEDPFNSYTTGWAGVSLRQRVMRKFTLGGGYGYSLYDTPQFPAAGRSVWTVFIGR